MPIAVVPFATFVPPGNWAELVPAVTMQPLASHEHSTRLITDLMEAFHYRHVRLDDLPSAAVHWEHIDALDPAQRFFLQPDVDGVLVRARRMDD